MAEEFTTRKEAEEHPGQSKYWFIELENAAKVEEKYRKSAERLIKKYQNEASEKVDFNIFWSNTETLKPATYSKRPAPDIRQRKLIKDPLGAVAAQILEAGVKVSTDCTPGYDFDTEKEFARDEMLITGRGVTRILYEANQVEILNPLTGNKEKAIGTQKVREIAISYQDYRQSPCSTWRDMRWIAYRHKPNRDELIEQFGAIGKDIPLNYSVIEKGSARHERELELDVYKRALVWEIWDKVKRERVWVAEGFDKIILIEPDPYKLEDFFPQAMPLYGFKAPGTMIPTPEYIIYEEQASVLNLTSAKIKELTKALDAKGIYPAVMDEVKKLTDASNGELLAVNIAAGYNINDMIAWWPVDKIAQVLLALYQSRDQSIQVIYQVTGISDLVRGSTNPNESATAQRLKGDFGNLRMNPRTAPMQRHIRDSYKLIAEIIAEHYTKENLEAIFGQPISPEVMMTLRDDKLRNISIDIETDSTVQPDADSDKQLRIEFISAVTGFVEKMAPLVAGGVMPAETAKAMLSFGIRGFKTGRELEDAVDQIGQQPPAPQSPPPPDPEMEKVKMQSQIEMQKMQAEQVKAQQQAQSQEQIEKYKIDRQIELELQKAHIEAEAKIMIARIQAEAGLHETQITSETQENNYEAQE